MSGADREAMEAVGALQGYYGLAYASADAYSRFAKCHDETKGYAPLLACVEEAHRMAEQGRVRIPAAAKFSSGCGAEVEVACRGVISGMPGFLGDYLAWLKGNEKKLRPAMAARTVADAAEVTKVEAAPIYLDDKYKAANFSNVTQIACTKRVFQCGPPDNVCWVNKVVDRLGISPEPSTNKVSGSANDRLVVRATGRAVAPLAK